jgi:ParB family chromosome partitioning protein
LTAIDCFDSLVGSLEDIDVSDIAFPRKVIRPLERNIEELVDSIHSIGLLQPIVVRIQKSNYEIVAGCRRFYACKKLGWRKIPCHVVELDDKQSFEISIIENIQRNSMNAIEEGWAFRYYVREYGWGGVSELAKVISKNPSYVSRRIKLTEFPEEILNLINESQVSVTIAEELSRIKDTRRQIMLASQISKMSLSFREARKFIQYGNNFVGIEEGMPYSRDEEQVMEKYLTRCILVLKIALRKFSTVINRTEKNWVIHDLLMEHKNLLNDQITILIKERKKWIKREIRC